MNARERSLISLIDLLQLVKKEMCIIIVLWDQGQCPTWPHACHKSD